MSYKIAKCRIFNFKIQTTKCELQTTIELWTSLKGANIHMIAALTQTGLVNFSTQRGSFRHIHFNNWLTELLANLINGAVGKQMKLY